MAKYTITMSCGHEDTIALFGKGSERERKIEYYKNHGLCKECYKKKMEEKEANEELAFCADVLPWIDDDQDILLSVWFSGDTKPNKEAIKGLGYSWSERESAEDFYTIAYVPMCWNKIIKLDDLKEEIQKAISVGAKCKITKSLFSSINYQIAKDKQQECKAIKTEISKIQKPIMPEILKGRKWNQKIYGKTGNHTIYLDNEKTMITDDQADEIESYLKAKKEYENKVAEIKSQWTNR